MVGTVIMCVTGGSVAWVIMSYTSLLMDKVFGTDK